MDEGQWNALLFLFSLACLLVLLVWNFFDQPVQVSVSELDKHVGENVYVIARPGVHEWRGSALRVQLDANHAAVLFSPSVAELDLADSNHWLKWFGKIARFRGELELQVSKVEEAR